MRDRPQLIPLFFSEYLKRNRCAKRLFSKRTALDTLFHHPFATLWQPTVSKTRSWPSSPFIFFKSAWVYVNTLMLQQVLLEQHWWDRMTEEDYRALTPLIYTHVNPYGEFNLDMSKRLPIESTSAI